MISTLSNVSSQKLRNGISLPLSAINKNVYSTANMYVAYLIYQRLILMISNKSSFRKPSDFAHIIYPPRLIFSKVSAFFI